MTKIVRLKDGVYGLNTKPAVFDDDALFAYDVDSATYFIESEESKEIIKLLLDLDSLPDVLYVLMPYETYTVFISIEEPTPIADYDGGFNYGTSACITLPEKQFKYILIGAEND